MKNLYTLCIMTSVATLIGATANATTMTPIYADGVSARNARAIQHSILTDTLHTYEGTMSSALGTRAKIGPDEIKKKTATRAYGHDPMYGKMVIYGEYNDDGTATMGHNGGDVISLFNNMWANWQHFDDSEKFDHFDKIESDYDILTVAVSGGHTQLGKGISQFGLFGGYAGGTQETKPMKIDQKSGYLGVYSGYNLDALNISAALSTGIMCNDMKYLNSTSQDYNNTWAGMMAHVAYNIAIDRTLTIQPELFAEYTWVKSENYNINNLSVVNKNLDSTSITPGVRVIKNIIGDWFGTVGLRHVITWESGGDTYINGTRIFKLESSNYTEYGIGIEKNIDNFNVAIHINRRDGGRTGWNGGTSIKYIF